MIKNIIFDIGQVLAEFRWREYMQDLGFEEERLNRVAKATVEGPFWREIDRSAFTFHEIIDRCVLADPEMEDSIRLFFSSKSALVKEFVYAKPWILELKERGYRVYLLSNYGKDYYDCVKHIFTFVPYVDGGVISYEIKKIKPEPEIYLELLNRYHLRAEESVFLDDVEENIDGAERIGIHGIHFTNYELARRELEHLLSLC